MRKHNLHSPYSAVNHCNNAAIHVMLLPFQAGILGGNTCRHGFHVLQESPKRIFHDSDQCPFHHYVCGKYHLIEALSYRCHTDRNPLY